jgi:hypothetical protein
MYLGLKLNVTKKQALDCVKQLQREYEADDDERREA